MKFLKKVRAGKFGRRSISGSVAKFTGDGVKSLGHINNVVESSFAVGIGNSVLSPFSYAEGSFNSINGTGFSHAEGRYNQIIAGNVAHVEGKDNIAGHNQAHAEGYCTQALGNQSHAEGAKTIAHNHGEHACGVWNLSTKASDKAQATQFSIGIGTGESNRKNGIEVKKNGDVYVEGISGTLQNNISNRYTKSEVDQKIADIDINIEGADIDLSNYAKKTDLEPIQTGLQKVTDKVFNNYTGVYNVANDTKLCGEFKSFELIIRMGDLAPNTLNASRSELLKDNKGNPILFHNNSGTVVLETPLKKPEGGTQYPRSTVNATFKSGDIMHFVANISGNTLELYVNGLKGYTLNQEDWCIYDREQLLWGYTVLGRFDNSVKVLGFRTFNYVLTQSDVDMLYNQGRSGDVKLIDEYRNSFTGINTNKTYSDYTSENWITPNKVELTFLTKTRVIVLYAQNKQKGGIYIFRGKIQGTNGEFPSDFSASDASNYNYKILSKEYNKNTGEFFFKLLATGPTWFFHQFGNTSTKVCYTVSLEF